MGRRFRLHLKRSRGSDKQPCPFVQIFDLGIKGYTAAQRARLKLLENLQPMECRRLADILPANKAMVIYYLATSRRRSILVFRLPLAFGKSCSLK